MKFNDRNYALLGIPDLPINAFKHIGDRKIKPQGGISSFLDSVTGLVDDVVGGVSDALAGVDDAVNESVGWPAVLTVAGGVGAGANYFSSLFSPSVSLAEAGAGAAAAGGASSGTGLTLSGGGLGLSAGGGGLGITAGSAGAGAIGGSLGTTLAGITTGVGAGAALAGLEAGSGTGLLSSGTGLTTGGSGLGLTSEGGLGLTTGSAGANTIGAGLGETLAAIDTGIASGVGGAVSSSVLSSIASATGIPLDTLKTFTPSVIQGLIGATGSYLQSEQAKEAAKIQADAQIRAAQIAADAARFRPVGVTTRFGSSNFTTDAQGNVIGAGYTPSAEITGYQDRLRTLAGQGMTDIEGARAAYQPLTGAAQSLFGLGQGYLNRDLGQPITSMGQQYMQSQAGQPLTQLGQQYIASDVGQPLTSLGQQYLQKSPDQIAADYITKQQALLAPTQENQLAQLQNRLFQQGRGGAATAQGGNLMATSPEMAAYYNALAQSNLQLAANAGQAGQQQTQFGADLYAKGLGLTSGRQVQGADLYRQGTGLTQAQQLAGADLYRQGTGLTMEGQKFGAGLFDTGAGLQGKYYTGQTGAYAPFTTAMDTSTGLESLAQQPLTLSTQIGAKTTASAADVGRLTGQGIINAAQTMAPANAYSGTGNLLAGAANSPNVTGLLNNAFGVQPQQTALDAEKLRIFKQIFGT